MIPFYVTAALVAFVLLAFLVIAWGRGRYFDGYRDGQIDSAYPPPSLASREVVAEAEAYVAEAAREWR